MTRRLLVIPFGGCDEAAASLASERFAGAAPRVMERSDLRRLRPSALRALARSWDDVVMVQPDITTPRATLGALLLVLTRARRRWLADRNGRLEPFGAAYYLRVTGPRLFRHALACLLAIVLAAPALALLEGLLAMEARTGRRRLLPVPHPVRRVLYLRSQFWLGLRGGGSVAHTAGVIDGLTACGVDVDLVSSDRLYGVDAPTHVVPPVLWFDGALREVEQLAYNGPFLGAALRRARSRRPDVVYQRYEAHNVAGVVLSRILRLPLVLEFNSSDVWKGIHWGGLRLTALARRSERICLRGADRIVVVSEVLRDQLVRMGIDAGRVVVNPNGVDPCRFRPDISGATVRSELGLDGAVVVGFSGTFGVWHGIPTLATAIPRVLARRPDARFLLIGDGPLRSVVEQAASDPAARGRVVFTGMVPHARMPEMLAACDILVSPHGRQADGEEFFGSPTKLYEYMAAGRAIVASAVGQIRDALTDGESALLVPPDDPVSLTDAIVRLVEDAPLRARLGAAGRADAEQRHTWQRNAERVLDSVTGSRP